MSTLIQINVTNKSSQLQNIFFFQQPAQYAGGPQVYTNSLLSTPLLPFSTSGSVYTFLLKLQYYAGVQQQVSPPVVGQPSGYSSALQAINLTPAAGGTSVNNSTDMSISPLGLSVPTANPAVQTGAFRINSPVFEPDLGNYNAGSAVQMGNGAVVLSNFVTVVPNSHLDCQPVLKFYVATGNYSSGTVMNFTSSSATAATCDATNGFTTFNVSYNTDGTWSSTPSVSKLKLASGSVVRSADMNAHIKNEAGTAVICSGHASNFNTPTTIEDLSNPNEIILHHEYQVGPINGPFVGRMCIAKVGNTATFE